MLCVLECWSVQYALLSDWDCVQWKYLIKADTEKTLSSDFPYMMYVHITYPLFHAYLTYTFIQYCCSDIFRFICGVHKVPCFNKRYYFWFFLKVTSLHKLRQGPLRPHPPNSSRLEGMAGSAVDLDVRPLRLRKVIEQRGIPDQQHHKWTCLLQGTPCF